MTPRQGGLACSCFAVADEVVIYIQGSKTDQYNLGCIRTQHEAAGSLRCPIRALRAWRNRVPHRFGGGHEAHRPVCRWSSGQGVGGNEVQALLELAAAAVGLIHGSAPPSRHTRW